MDVVCQPRGTYLHTVHSCLCHESILSPGQGWYRSAKAQNSTKAPLTGNPNQLGPHMLRDRAPPAPHLPHQLAPVPVVYFVFVFVFVFVFRSAQARGCRTCRTYRPLRVTFFDVGEIIDDKYC
jgi:hypothetical protein